MTFRLLREWSFSRIAWWLRWGPSRRHFNQYGQDIHKVFFLQLWTRSCKKERDRHIPRTFYFRQRTIELTRTVESFQNNPSLSRFPQNVCWVMRCQGELVGGSILCKASANGRVCDEHNWDVLSQWTRCWARLVEWALFADRSTTQSRLGLRCNAVRPCLSGSEGGGNAW